MLSDEQVLILQTAQKIGEKVGRRYWLQCAREKKQPELVWDELLKAGLTGVGTGVDGGAGYGLLEAVLVQEGLARAGLPLLQFLTTHLSRSIIVKHGTRSQVERFVIPTCSEARKISFAVTEAEAGSNTWRIKTFAK
ncbi:MAG: acyl-CoA dehydrogenase family protein, partial [Candidatus Caldarchaeum sp.]